MKIKDLVVGQPFAISLVVKSSEIKTTRNNKPYLLADFIDGHTNIQSNIWDWTKPPILPNTIVDLEGTVTEYQGTPQLSISYIQPNTTLRLSDFAPQGDFDLDTYVSTAKTIYESFKSQTLKDIVSRVFKDNSDLWKITPGAKTIHHAFVAGTLKHSVDVARSATELAKLYPDQCCIELCTAGGLLHDFGKLWTYKLEGVVIDSTEDGELFDHIAIGIKELEKYKDEHNSKIVGLLQHIIASHHGKLEYGSPVTPRFLEAFIVNFADNIDAKAQTIRELNSKSKPGDILTQKEWSLENRKMFTQKYIQSIILEAP